MRNGVTIYCDKCDVGVFVESMMEIHNKTKTHEIKSAFYTSEDLKPHPIGVLHTNL